METPSRDAFIQGFTEYERREKRDPMYKVATFLLDYFWGKPSDMADALGVLLLTWNQAFYRYGPIDFERLEGCITKNLKRVEAYRQREILSLTHADESEIQDLFVEFMDALGIEGGKKSPVSSSKALHLLAPAFFPLWDEKIAKAYGCYYETRAAAQYIRFCRITKEIALAVGSYGVKSERTLVKLVDEYNYAKFTKGWSS